MTFVAEEAGQILSRDAQGWVLISRERRDSLLEEYGRSGMSGVKFAAYLGIWPMGRPKSGAWSRCVGAWCRAWQRTTAADLFHVFQQNLF
jgi:hypothetical protein